MSTQVLKCYRKKQTKMTLLILLESRFSLLVWVYWILNADETEKCFSLVDIFNYLPVSQSATQKEVFCTSKSRALKAWQYICVCVYVCALFQVTSLFPIGLFFQRQIFIAHAFFNCCWFLFHWVTYNLWQIYPIYTWKIIQSSSKILETFVVYGPGCPWITLEQGCKQGAEL